MERVTCSPEVDLWLARRWLNLSGVWEPRRRRVYCRRATAAFSESIIWLVTGYS
jgi:hypothetical protein